MYVSSKPRLRLEWKTICRVDMSFGKICDFKVGDRGFVETAHGRSL